MMLSSLDSMLSRCSLQQHPPPRQQCHSRHVLLISLLPRLSSRNALLLLSAKTPAISPCSLVPALSSLLRPCRYTKVRAPPVDTLSAANRHIPRSLCLGKHLRITRFRQSLPRRKRRSRTVHINHRSSSQSTWLFAVSQKLTAVSFPILSPHMPDPEITPISLRAPPILLRHPPRKMHQSPCTRCTAVPGPKSGSNPLAGHMPQASSYLLFLCAPILRGASVRITEPRVGGTVDRHPPEAIHRQSLHATATAKPFGLSLSQ